MRSFRLLLDPKLYEEWYRYFGSYGIRQTILRRVVQIMVFKAKQRAGIPVKKPLWMTEVIYEAPLGEAIEKEISKFLNMDTEGGE